MSGRNQEIARMYVEEGRSLSEVASKFGISRERVRQVLVAAGVDKRHHGGRKRAKYEAAIRNAHDRITLGFTTIKAEADVLGVKPDSLRLAFRKRHLRILRKKARHGTRSYYQHHRCQCELCLEANRAYTEGLKSQEPPHHGTYSGYSNYGCRCFDCRMAGREYRRALKRKRLGKEI